MRLWHISRNENLCTFKHNDFVPSIQFHPRDDRFFLAGSLDTKLRLWSIPDKSVAYTASVPDMITSVAFTPDGKTCIAGTLGGLCLFYDTEGLKWQSQIHVKSTRGQNAKGSKITGIQAVHWPPGSTTGDVKLLITSNDSRVRVYGFREKNLEMKFRGHENNCSQIRATFAEDTEHIICGSEDRKAYIWSTSGFEGEKRNQRPVEMFEAHTSITTCATIAPLKTRHLLSASEDPVFDLCNPPPVTLVSRSDSANGSKRNSDLAGSVHPTPTEANFRKVAESPAYAARSAHPDGHIIVTADYTGAIKVYRQDCAHHKRLRHDNWDAASLLSRRTGSLRMARPSSILSSRTGRSRRDSTSTQPASERIMSWQQNLTLSHGETNLNSPRRSLGRSVSPRKSMSKSKPPSRTSIGSRPDKDTTHSPTLAALPDVTTTTTTTTVSPGPVLPPPAEHTPPRHASTAPTPPKPSEPTPPPSQTSPLSQLRAPSASNPLAVYNNQSWAFWSPRPKLALAARNGFLAPGAAGSAEGEEDARPGVQRGESAVSQLSSEIGERSAGEEEEGEGERCERCGGREGRRRWRGIGGSGREVGEWVCGGCGFVGGRER